MTIITIGRRPPVEVRPRTIYSMRLTESASAILTSERDAEGHLDVLRMDRLPAGLDPAVRWLQGAIPDIYAMDRGFQVILDAEGLGRALWDHLQVHHRRGWTLFEAHGRDRQALPNALLIGEQERRIHIRQGQNADAMHKALLAYRREVLDDGIVGAELVVALALALVVPTMTAPRIQ